MRRSRFINILVVTLVALGTLSACSKSPEDLEVWRPSAAENGLDKLSEWIADPAEPMPVRLRACEILFEEDYAYAVDASLAKLEPAEQKQFATALLPIIKGWYDAKDATLEKLSSKASKQLIGKEAAFRMRGYAGEGDIAAYDAMLIDWISADYVMREQVGTAKFAQIAELVGPAAAPPLLDALALPANNQKYLADMLRKIKDDSVAEKTAGVLVKMGKSQLPKLDTDLQVAILEEPHPSVVPVLVSIVNAKGVDNTIKDAAHTKIGKIKGAKSVGTYLTWVKAGPEVLRWVSIQAIAENAGKAGIGPMLAALPDDGQYGAEAPKDGFSVDAERFCQVEVKEEIADKGANVEPIFIKALGKGSAASKAIALQCLSVVGSAKARPAVEGMLKDKSKVPAWKGAKTLGDIAKKTLAKLPAS